MQPERQLDQFIYDELINDSDDIDRIRNDIKYEVMYKLNIENDNDRPLNEPIDIYEMKKIIWFNSSWPPFVDPGSNIMWNLIDHVVPNQMAIELMQLLTQELPVDFVNSELVKRVSTKVI